MFGKTFNERVSVFVATWFYTGLIPPIILKGMAGTYGSFFSIPLCYLALYVTGMLSGLPLVYILFIAGIYVFGAVSIELAEKVIGPKTDWKGKTKKHDQNQIVIDEVFGMLITCYPLIYMKIGLFSWSGAIMISLAFIYFRFFDIVKVWPTKVFDRMESSLGVMMDDAMAGLYAAGLLYLSYLLFF